MAAQPEDKRSMALDEPLVGFDEAHKRVTRVAESNSWGLRSYDPGDIVQETFKRAKPVPPSEPGAELLYDWPKLCVTARYVSHEFRRKERRTQSLDGIDFQKKYGDAEAAVSSTYERITLEKCVAKIDEILTDAEAQVFTLRFVEGLGYDQMEKRTGIKAATLRTRISRACDRIRQSPQAPQIYHLLKSIGIRPPDARDPGSGG